MFNRAEQKTVNYCIAQAIEDACSSLIDSCLTQQGLVVMAAASAVITGLCYLAVIKTAEDGDECDEPSPSMRLVM